MTKDDVAAALDEIGTLLSLKGENDFRTRAYHNGSRAIAQMPGDLAETIAAGKLAEVRGIGEALRDKVKTLVTTGKLPYLEELRASVPAGLVEMLRIPGVGPKKVYALHKELERRHRGQARSRVRGRAGGRPERVRGEDPGAHPRRDPLPRHRRQPGPDRRGAAARPRPARPGEDVPRRRPGRAVRQPPPAEGDGQGHRHRRQQRRPAGGDGRVREAAAGDAGDRPRADQVVDRRRADGRERPGRAQRRPAGGHRRPVPGRGAALHREQGPQRPPSAEGQRPRPDPERVRPERAERDCPGDGRGRRVRGPGPGLGAARDARGHRRDRTDGGRHRPDADRARRRPRRLPQPHHGQRRDGVTRSDGPGRQGTRVRVLRRRRPLAIAVGGQRAERQAGEAAVGRGRRVERQAEGHSHPQGDRVRHPRRRQPRLPGRVAGRVRLRGDQRPHPFRPGRAGADGPVVQGAVPPGGDHARPRHRPAAAPPGRDQARHREGASSGRGPRQDDRDQRPAEPARSRLGPRQAGEGARHPDRHQPGRPQSGRTRPRPVRRKRRPPGLADQGRRVQLPAGRRIEPEGDEGEE